MAYPTGAEILAFVGATSPSAPETAWADACASAVEAGITTRLNGVTIDPYPQPMQDELEVAAMLAGANCYKRREASYSNDINGSAANIAGDYLEGIKPIADRYGNGPGIG
jgi:hypothetical protein